MRVFQVLYSHYHQLYLYNLVLEAQVLFLEGFRELPIFYCYERIKVDHLRQAEVLMLESGVLNFTIFTILVFSHFVLVQVRIVQVRINKFEITEKATFIKKIKIQ